MAKHDFDSLQRWLCQKALVISGYPDIPQSEAYKVMAHEPELLIEWWRGAFDQSESEAALLDSAARAFAHGKPLPKLSLAQRGRLALRLRLASRILRAYRNKSDARSRSWFPVKLHKLSEPKLLEWLLIYSWPMCVEIFDETLAWADEFEHPPGRSMKRRPKAISPEDSSSFSA